MEASSDSSSGSFDASARDQGPKLRILVARFTKSATAPDLDMSLRPRCRIIELDAVSEATTAGEDLDGTIIATTHLTKTKRNTAHECRFFVLLTKALSDERHDY